MKKDNTVLLIIAGAIGAYFLMPEKIKEQITPGGAGGISLGGLLGDIKMPEIKMPGINLSTIVNPAGEFIEGAKTTVTELAEDIKNLAPDIENPLPEVGETVKEAVENALGAFDLSKYQETAETQDQRNLVEKALGLEHREDVSAWDRWSRFWTGWQNLLPDWHLWDKPGYGVMTQEAETILATGVPTLKRGITETESPTKQDLSGEVWEGATTAQRLKWAFTGKGLPGTVSYPGEAVSKGELQAQAERDPGLARAYKKAEELAKKYGVS